MLDRGHLGLGDVLGGGESRSQLAGLVELGHAFGQGPHRRQFLGLTRQGLVITDPAAATTWGALIQADELLRVPIGTTERNLIMQGFDPLMAGTYIACAERTLVVGA